MIGTSISRWTMTYFAVALVWLFVGLLMMIAGAGYPLAAVGSPDTLVLVHVICIGWLSLAMCGALFQFVPVLVAQPLFSGRCELPALLLLSAGLIALTSGFLSLGGRLPPAPWSLPLGAILLGSGFGIVIVNLGITALRRPTGPARFVLVGLASLAGAVGFGTIFTFALSGRAGSMGQLVLEAGIPLHAIAGLGGWLTLTAVGVSYRLLPMFILSPDVDDRRSRITLIAGTLALVAAGFGGTISIWVGAETDAATSIAAVLAFISLCCYGRDLFMIFRDRKRKQLELSMWMATLSPASLMATASLIAVLLATRTFVSHVGAVAFIAVFGWLSGLVLSKLYKIVAFLTWLETYGPVMGRVPTPRVQDLAVEGRASKWFVIYYVSAWSGTAMLLNDQASAFQSVVVVMTIGVVGIVRELVRIRRLDDVPRPQRLPGGAVAPSLLFAKN